MTSSKRHQLGEIGAISLRVACLLRVVSSCDSRTWTSWRARAASRAMAGAHPLRVAGAIDGVRIDRIRKRAIERGAGRDGILIGPQESRCAASSGNPASGGLEIDDRSHRTDGDPPSRDRLLELGP